MHKKYHLYPWEIWFLKQLRRWRNTLVGRVVQKKIIDNPDMRIPFQAIPLWVASALTGLVAVAYEDLFVLFEQSGKALLAPAPWVVFLTTPILFALAWYMTARIAPNARGSGIPQLLAAVDLAGTSRQALIQRLLNLRVALVKIGASLVLLMGGGAIGREGPTLQIAGSVFDMVYRWVPEGWPKVSHRIMLITGGASGLAAAFNTPLGGIVYALEELTKSHIARFRTAVFSAVIIAGMTAQSFLGSYLYLGYPKLATLPVGLIWLVLVLGFLSGYLGAQFTMVLRWIGQWRSQFRGRKKQLGVVLGLGLVFATLLFFTGTIGMGTGKPLINQVLFEGAASAPWYTFPVRVLAAVLSFSIGAPGGIFATSLSSGASLGAFIVHWGGLPAEHHNLMILVCMIGFLTGVTRTPFTAAILVLEMTDRHSAIFYFLLASMIAQFGAGWVSKRSFYEYQKEVYLDQLTAKG
ncbi:MAG: chloride channel protein [Lewinellaceae bacterium]|nr:chloride channel protein [Saprospiraceae bacterium]MCB9316284.1 chloride channel protein [Lewinellaceae bacterium]MCB9332991.1 chloride channel protein [Lewinellaceae bacterium]